MNLICTAKWYNLSEHFTRMLYPRKENSFMEKRLPKRSAAYHGYEQSSGV